MTTAKQCTTDILARPRWRKTRFIARWTGRAVKSVLLLILISAMLITTWVVWTNHRGPHEVAVVTQDIIDRGISLDLPDAINDGDNGASYYLAAGELLSLDEALYNGAPVVGLAEWPLFAERFTDEQIILMRQILLPNESAFKLTRRARDFDQFAYEIDEVFAMQEASDKWGKLRRLARFLSLKMYLAVGEGDTSNAVECIRDQIHLARSVQAEDGIAFNLAVRTASTAIANGNIEDLLSRTELSESDLTALADDLETLIQPDRFWTMSAHPARLFAWYTADPKSMQALLHMEHINAVQIARVWQNAFEISDDELESSWLELFAERLTSVRIAINPGAYQIGAAQEMKIYLELLDEIKAGKMLDNDQIDSLRDEGYESIAGLAFQQKMDIDLQAQLITTIYGLAAERYRLQHGDWPSDWNQFSPDQKPPADPWGQALRFLSSDVGFRVYTVGRNGIDEEGTHQWDDDEAYEADDFNFRLLNPVNRGKTPTAIPLFSDDLPSALETFEDLRDDLKESLESNPSVQ